MTVKTPANRATVMLDIDGRKYLYEFDFPSVDVNVGSQYDACWPGRTEIRICGPAKMVSDAPTVAKQEPAKEPKKPSVKASAERVRKATVSNAKLAKKINDAEIALRDMNREKERLNVELKTAREQLLASATPDVR